MTRVALIGLAVLSLVTVAGAQQPAAPADEPWPPADAVWPKDGATLPKPVHEGRPQFTSDAMRQNISGKVGLECVVETDGTVRRVHVVRSVDKLYGLDEAAVRAAREWRFEPGTKGGVAVPVLITIDMAFVLASPPWSHFLFGERRPETDD